jgi:hypothetical protein
MSIEAKRAVLDYNPFSHRVKYFHQEDGKNYIAGSQDVEPIIKWTKQRAEQGDAPGSEMKFVATIPQEVLDQAMLEGWFHDQAAWKRWMAENPKFTAKYHQ